MPRRLPESCWICVAPAASESSETDMPTQPLPNTAFLDRFRTEVRRRVRFQLLGGHRTRNLGQSLEYRDHAAYVPGHDFRRLDVRRILLAQDRPKLSPWDGWQVCRFESEQRLQILVSVDSRPTMAFPEPIEKSKLQVARWLAQSVGILALEDHDSVMIHSLFAKSRLPVARPRDRGELDALLGRICDPLSEEPDQLNTFDLGRVLPPSGVWIIVSDFYFDSRLLEDLVGRVRAARRGRRWVMLMDLNSWPRERAMLGKNQPWTVVGPGQSAGNVDLRIQSDDDTLMEVEKNIDKHKRRMAVTSAEQHELESGRWDLDSRPLDGKKPFESFRQKFVDNKLLRDLFARQP